MTTREQATTPIKILVLGGTFGGGMRAAAGAMSDYYRSRYPGEVKVEVVDFFEEFAPNLNVLAKFAFQQTDDFFPVGSGTFDELRASLPHNTVVQELDTAGLRVARKRVEDLAPDAVISTFSIAGGVMAEIARDRLMLSATVIVGYRARGTWVHPGTDLYFVASDEAREDLVVRGVPWARIVVTGVPVAGTLADTTPAQVTRAAVGLADRFTVLLAPAGAGADDTAVLASRLAAAGVQVVVLAGGSDRLAKRLGPVAARQPRVKVVRNVDGLHSMMDVADVLVGSVGGSMVAEALAAGMPLLVLDPVPGQEFENVDFLVNHGAAMWCRDEDDAIEKVRFLSTHPGRLAEMSVNAGRLGRRGAAQSVCERVLAAVRTDRV